MNKTLKFNSPRLLWKSRCAVQKQGSNSTRWNLCSLINCTLPPLQCNEPHCSCSGPVGVLTPQPFAKLLCLWVPGFCEALSGLYSQKLKPVTELWRSNDQGYPPFPSAQLKAQAALSDSSVLFSPRDEHNHPSRHTERAAEAPPLLMSLELTPVPLQSQTDPVPESWKTMHSTPPLRLGRLLIECRSTLWATFPAEAAQRTNVPQTPELLDLRLFLCLKPTHPEGTHHVSSELNTKLSSQLLSLPVSKSALQFPRQNIRISQAHPELMASTAHAGRASSENC